MEQFFAGLFGSDGGAGEARESSGGWPVLGLVAGPLVGTKIGKAIGGAATDDSKPYDGVQAQEGRPKVDADSGESSLIRPEAWLRPPFSFR